MKIHHWVESRNYRLSVIEHKPESVKAGAPLVICCHGFTADKVGANQLMLNMGKALERAGIPAVRFDYAGSGESEGEFAKDTTVKAWQHDLQSILAWVKQQPEIAGLPVYLLGHSLGGLIVLTADYPAIAGRIAVSPVIHPIANFRDIIFGGELWKNSLDGQTIANFIGKGFSLEPDFVRDLLAGEYAPLVVAKTYRTPLLIVHGDNDAVVPIEGSRELAQVYGGEKEFTVLPADHVFTGQHKLLQNVVVEWLAKR